MSTVAGQSACEQEGMDDSLLSSRVEKNTNSVGSDSSKLFKESGLKSNPKLLPSSASEPQKKMSGSFSLKFSKRRLRFKGSLKKGESATDPEISSQMKEVNSANDRSKHNSFGEERSIGSPGSSCEDECFADASAKSLGSSEHFGTDSVGSEEKKKFFNQLKKFNPDLKWLPFNSDKRNTECALCVSNAAEKLDAINKSLVEIGETVSDSKVSAFTEISDIRKSLLKVKLESEMRFETQSVMLIAIFVRLLRIRLEAEIAAYMVLLLGWILLMYRHRDYFLNAQSNQAKGLEKDEKVEDESDSDKPKVEQKAAKAADKRGMKFNFLEDSGISFSVVYDMLSEEEKQIFKNLKLTFQSQIKKTTKLNRSEPFTLPDDFNILRYLQADKFDIKPACERLISTVCWRQANHIDDLPENPPPEIDTYRTYRSCVVIGRDRYDQPIHVERVGRFFGSSEVPRALSIAQWLRCYSYEMAELFKEFRQASIDSGKVVHKRVYIGDLKGIRFSAIKKLNFMTTLKNEVEVHFPEIAGPIILINAPAFLARVWSMVSKALDPAVVGKIRIFPGIPTQFLIEQYGRDLIPVEYGGTNPIQF
mmetsp:Transcript_10910/g.13185  ORF Transcript_10910/g.13185 Transcript_10910/m.13185 type:complete len:591 (+) Transcript_10910:314-2086(+)